MHLKPDWRDSPTKNMNATIAVIATAPTISVPNDFQFCEAIIQSSHPDLLMLSGDIVDSR
jgi:hypothetical protein